MPRYLKHKHWFSVSKLKDYFNLFHFKVKGGELFIIMLFPSSLFDFLKKIMTSTKCKRQLVKKFQLIFFSKGDD